MKRHALLLLLALPLLACPGGGGGPLPDGGSLDGGPDAGPTGPDGGGLPDGGDVDGGEVLPELKLTRVLPPRGVAAGGTQVTLTGSGFVAGVAETATEAGRGTTLRFGTNPAQDFQVVDDGIIDVRVPPGRAGTVDVTLTNARGSAVCAGCFTYFDELSLRSVAPNQGPDTGANEVVLAGTGFTDELVVLFGTRRSPRVTVVSSTQVRAVVPAAAAGERVDVLVYSPNGLGVLRRAYLYQPRLRVTDVQPRTADVGGAVEVELVGTGLAAATAVSFGGVPAPITAAAAGSLTVQVPASFTPGAVDITVTTPGETWTVQRGFTWLDAAGPAALFAAYPRLLPATGGPVTLVGQGLGAATAVRLGGVPVGFAPGGPGALQVDVPASAAFATSVLDVAVDVPGQAQPLLLPRGLTFRVALASMAPATGPQGGGTPGTLVGTHVPQDARVLVGVLDAAAVAVTPGGQGTQATFLTPPGSSGGGTAGDAPQDVWVRSAADLENEAWLLDAFTFGPAPVDVARVQAERGAIAGGTLVTVYGDGFGEDTVVDFGPGRAKDVKVLDAHVLTCRIPKADVGTVDVRGERHGTSDVLVGGFSFFDPRNLSGGLSGGPLSGTLNVTVLDGTRENYGAPIALAGVMLGTDPFTPFQGTTDQRGQLTFSDPALVKAQTVTVWKEGYQSVTVTGVSAQNLTVLVTPTGGDGQPAPPPPGPPPSLIMGHVTGFKAPRPLGKGERLEARVFVAQESVFQGPPFANPRARQGETWVLTQDGEEYLVASGAGIKAVYAILGINDGTTFTPALMGVRRGIAASPDAPAQDQDILLDTHLDVTTPILLQGPVLGAGGAPLPSELYAWLDVGAEGYVPHPLNWNAGTQPVTSVVATGTGVDFPHFPQLDGSNFLFLSVAFVQNGYSVVYRRQPGALTDGVSIAPMLQVPTFTAPTRAQGMADNRIAWTTQPGPTPDIQQVDVLLPTPAGAVSLWSIILPGQETQVTLPAGVVTKLRQDAQGATLVVSILASRSPRFRYDQWSYIESLSALSWTSFAGAQSEGFVP